MECCLENHLQTRCDVECKQNIQQNRVQRNEQHAHEQQHQRRKTQVVEVEFRQVLSKRRQGQRDHGEILEENKGFAQSGDELGFMVSNLSKLRAIYS